MIVKIRAGCQYNGHFYYNENLNWATRNLGLCRMRPVRGLEKADVK